MLLEHADLTEKVALLTLLTNGTRVGALAELRYKDVKPIIFRGFKFYRFVPYGVDLNERYITFCTPECASMIDIYFKHLTRKEVETLTDDSPFITHRTNSIYGVKKKGFYSSKALQKMLERLRYDTNIDSKTVIKSGKHAESGRVRKHTMRAHVFRKIFNTRCVENNVNHTVKESLMGHKAGLGQDVSYFRENNIKELAEYMKVVESLTISQENKLSKKLQDKDNVIYVQLKEKYEQINKLWKVVKESRESNEAWRMHTFNALQGVIQMKQDEINKLKTKGKIIIKRKSS